MKIIYNDIIPFKGFKAINLFGVLFEREAYAHDSDLTYLSTRPRFAWWKYR